MQTLLCCLLVVSLGNKYVWSFGVVQSYIGEKSNVNILDKISQGISREMIHLLTRCFNKVSVVLKVFERTLVKEEPD